MTGKHIKIVVGSKVINEGISLANVGAIHVLDYTFNKNKTIQTIGRIARYCRHSAKFIHTKEYQKVQVFKYLSLPDDFDIKKTRIEDPIEFNILRIADIKLKNIQVIYNKILIPAAIESNKKEVELQDYDIFGIDEYQFKTQINTVKLLIRKIFKLYK
jgi:excinuclease UvrABC helicase subunit UvrB